LIRQWSDIVQKRRKNQGGETRQATEDSASVFASADFSLKVALPGALKLAS
jgi:hypothetical protein